MSHKPWRRRFSCLARSAEVARQPVPMSKSGHQKCPFTSITIEGEPQKVTNNVVYLKGTPSGWSGSFRWNMADKTPEQFAARIMDLLQAEPAGSSSSSSTTKS
eukprot:1771255-Prymnesium_polylepis.2